MSNREQGIRQGISWLVAALSLLFLLWITPILFPHNVLADILAGLVYIAFNLSLWYKLNEQN